MTKRKNSKKTQELSFTQEVIRSDVKGLPFDLVLRFDSTVDQPQLFMDELVKMTLEGLIERYGSIIIKINWWDSGLTVIAPNDVPLNDENWSVNHADLNTSVALQEAPESTEDQEVTPTT